MSDAFLGEIRMTGFNFAPRGWAKCDGNVLPIDQNQAMFSILGNAYGGDGRVDFALPDLRGRVPFNVGNGFSLGQDGGEETTTLTTDQLPAHTHTLQAANVAPNTATPTGNILAQAQANRDHFADPNNLVAMRTSIFSTNSSPTPYDNMQPFLVINFIIAMEGTFPSRN